MGLGGAATIRRAGDGSTGRFAGDHSAGHVAGGGDGRTGGRAWVAGLPHRRGRARRFRRRSCGDRAGGPLVPAVFADGRHRDRGGHGHRNCRSARVHSSRCHGHGRFLRRRGVARPHGRLDVRRPWPARAGRRRRHVLSRVGRRAPHRHARAARRRRHDSGRGAAEACRRSGRWCPPHRCAEAAAVGDGAEGGGGGAAGRLAGVGAPSRHRHHLPSR